jgi:hypothetical protein
MATPPFLHLSTPSDKITKNILKLLEGKSAENPPRRAGREVISRSNGIQKLFT